MTASIQMNRPRKILFSVSAITFLGPLLLANDENQVPADDSGAAEEIAEITVYGERPDKPVELDTKYEENLRDQIIKDLDRLRVLEEDDWRSADTTTVNNPSRIKWGYDPRDEVRMRRDTSLTDLPTDDTKPATIFSIEF